MLHVLIVIPQEHVREAMAASARSQSCTVLLAAGAQDAAAWLERSPPHLLVLGSRLPDGEPADVLGKAREQGVSHTIQVKGENLVASVCALLVGIIEASALRDESAHMAAGQAGTASVRIPMGSDLNEMRRRLILTTLAHSDGQRGLTATRLGIAVDELNRWLREHGLATVDPVGPG